MAALVKFVSSQQNICAEFACHTHCGVIRRPFSRQSDEGFMVEVLWTYQNRGAKGTERTIYPAVSACHDYRYHPREVITGVFDELASNHLGFFVWTVEFWNPHPLAGISEIKCVEWYRAHPIEDDRKMHARMDDALRGRGVRPGCHVITPISAESRYWWVGSSMCLRASSSPSVGARDFTAFD